MQLELKLSLAFQLGHNSCSTEMFTISLIYIEHCYKKALHFSMDEIISVFVFERNHSK